MSFLKNPGHCILQLWDHGSTLLPCRCPLCRRPINLLIPTEASMQQRVNPEVANIIGRLELYNRRYGERSNNLNQVSLDIDSSLFFYLNFVLRNVEGFIPS